MLFKLIEAASWSQFYTPQTRQWQTGEWNKPAPPFLAVTYEHWAKINQKSELLALLAP